jgi:hypothetical protein
MAQETIQVSVFVTVTYDENAVTEDVAENVCTGVKYGLQHMLDAGELSTITGVVVNETSAEIMDVQATCFDY